MYEAYWQLHAKPFENTSDTRFYYPAESHQAALLKLRYAVEIAGAVRAGGGFRTGQVARRAISAGANSATRITPRVHVVFPQMPADQLLAYLAESLTGDAPLPGRLRSSTAFDGSSRCWRPMCRPADMP